MHKKCVLQNYKEAQQLVVCQYQKTYWKRNPEITKYFSTKCDALRDLVPFAQFKKRENNPWGSVNFSKVAGWSLQLFKINTPPWVFFTLLKLSKWYQIAQRTTNVILKPVHTNWCKHILLRILLNRDIKFLKSKTTYSYSKSFSTSCNSLH